MSIAPGVLVVLDAHPGGIIFKDLVPEYVDFVRTIYEGYSLSRKISIFLVLEEINLLNDLTVACTLDFCR